MIEPLLSVASKIFHGVQIAADRRFGIVAEYEFFSHRSAVARLEILPTSQRIAVVGAAIFYVIAGALHFIKPARYLRIMPPYIPWHVAMVRLSGGLEILGGLGLLVTLRRCSGGDVFLDSWSLSGGCCSVRDLVLCFVEAQTSASAALARRFPSVMWTTVARRG